MGQAPLSRFKNMCCWRRLYSLYIWFEYQKSLIYIKYIKINPLGIKVFNLYAQNPSLPVGSLTLVFHWWFLNVLTLWKEEGWWFIYKYGMVLSALHSQTNTATFQVLNFGLHIHIYIKQWPNFPPPELIIYITQSKKLLVKKLYFISTFRGPTPLSRSLLKHWNEIKFFNKKSFWSSYINICVYKYIYIYIYM